MVRVRFCKSAFVSVHMCVCVCVCVLMYVCMYVCVCHACFRSVVGNKRKFDDRPQYFMDTDRVTSVSLQNSITLANKDFVP